MKNKLLSLVVPLYCEENTIDPLVKSLQYYLTKTDVNFEIILVDDGSEDHTWRNIVCVTNENKMIKGIRLSRNFGKEAALIAGLEAAKGDAVITLDADFQHPHNLIPQFIEEWQNGYQVVEGVKISGQSFINFIFSTIFNKTLKIVDSENLRGSSDFKLLDKRALNALLQLRECAPFYRGMSSWIGFKHKKIGFCVNQRQSGKSKWSFMSRIRLAVESITSFTSLPIKIIYFITTGFILISLLFGIIGIYQYFIEKTALPGFLTIILLYCISMSFIFICLSCISQYIHIILKEVKDRPRYIIIEETNNV